MTLLFISIISGVLSVLAPCILAIIPLLVGYSSESKNNMKAVRVVIGLAISIFCFSILLKATTLLIAISASTWQLVSGTIIILFGLTGLFPNIWEQIAVKLKLQQISANGQKYALKKTGYLGDFLLGASLGPIFSACSPTYALIVATILPVSPLRGVVYLIVFIVSLSITILVLAIGGRKIITKLGWSINPRGLFKRSLAVIFIVIGLLIISGLDKKILSFAVEGGLFDWQVNLENRLQQ